MRILLVRGGGAVVDGHDVDECADLVNNTLVVGFLRPVERVHGVLVCAVVDEEAVGGGEGVDALCEAAARECGEETRTWLASWTDVPEAAARMLAGDKVWSVRRALAACVFAPGSLEVLPFCVFF